MTPIPSFFYRRFVPKKPDVVAKGDGFNVPRRSGFVVVECYGAWRPAFEEAYRRYGASGVCIDQIAVRDEPSLDFLRRLPSLRYVNLTAVYHPIDLAVVLELEDLEYFSLNWVAREPPAGIDFIRLKRLKECSLPWYPGFASVLRCESLRILSLSDARKLRELDVTRLPRLAEIGLWSCPKLTSIGLSEHTGLLALQVINCVSFHPDWQRIGRDLRYLLVGGRIGFPVEGIANAKALLFLWTELASRYTPDVVRVLRELTALEGARVIDRKFTKNLADEVRAINEAKGNGRTVSANPRPYQLDD